MRTIGPPTQRPDPGLLAAIIASVIAFLGIAACACLYLAGVGFYVVSAASCATLAFVIAFYELRFFVGLMHENDLSRYLEERQKARSNGTL